MTHLDRVRTKTLACLKMLKFWRYFNLKSVEMMEFQHINGRVKLAKRPSTRGHSRPNPVAREVPTKNFHVLNSHSNERDTCIRIG